MGNVKLSRLQGYWKRDPFLWKQRYCNEHEQGQIFANHIWAVINIFNTRMSEVYYPGRELSLDESMILWRGRLSFRQYIMNKRHEYGIKVYMLNNLDGFINKCAVYTRMLDDLEGKGILERLFCLLQDKLNVGHHVYMDNYYNSFGLAKTLLYQKTRWTATLRLIKKNTPKDIVSAKLKKGKSIARYSAGVMIGKWKDRRDVSYISTEFENTMVEVENKRKQVETKPLPIVKYNAFMSGTDKQDQMLSYYLCERKTIRWPTKQFFHIIEIILFNAHYLYDEYSGCKIPLFDYRLTVIKGLLPVMEIPRGARTKHRIDSHIVKNWQATEGGKTGNVSGVQNE
ncbi:hypothetical protein PR048_015240, partial [Dryococelus australis]